MANLNKVFLMGNLTHDPEVRYIPSGTAVADLRMAVNERYKDRDSGEWREKPVFVDVTVWRRQAETAGEYLSKGSPVLIEGRLQLDQWETDDGQKRSKLKVTADRVQFLSSSGGGKGGGSSQQRQNFSRKPASPQGQRDTSPEPPEPTEVDDDNLPF